MFPRLSGCRRVRLMSLAVVAAWAFAVSPTIAQTSGGGTSGGGVGTSGGVGTGGVVGTGGGGGGGGVGAGKAVGANGGGGQSAQVLGPSKNLGVTDVAATNSQGGGAGNTTGVPSTFNPFRASYMNPYAAGMQTTSTTLGNAANRSNASTKGFGQPVYATTTTTGNNLGGVGGIGGIGGVQGLNGGVATTTADPFHFDNAGLRKTPAYSTVLADDLPVPAHPATQLAQSLRNVLDRSSQIRSQGTMQLRVENDVVILTGFVGNAREARLAENLLRLTPGVADVVNELQIK